MSTIPQETTIGERRLLRYFAEKDASLDRNTIAKEVGLHVVNVSKLVCSLERRGLLSIERNKTYRQGRRGYSKVTVTTAEESA